ncbi:MAG: N4-bis(aminopropyl)spermidine synthase [Chloroflexia bacterium]|jgi:predicted methyltransferase/DNA-directed RNA polymerase subunit RPC12/RpoP|nr:N4-bis(aminopropyl)spermidine synthase [Chloroflexia bacterium]
MPSSYSDKDRFLEGLARQVQLRGGAPDAERVLRAIFEHEQEAGADAMTERVLARIVRMPVPVVAAIRRELEQAEVLEPGLSIQMTPAARQTLAEEWGWQPLQQTAFLSTPPAPRSEKVQPQQTQVSQLCATCDGTGIAPSGPQWDAVLEGLQKHFPGKPRKVPAGGSARNQPTPDTNLRRAALMHEQNALAGKDVLVIGDDVTLAAAIALAGKALSPSGRLSRRLVALHSDDKVLRQLRDIAVGEGLIIGLVTHDLRRPLMEDLQGEFDTVFVDAPQGYAGVVLAVSRAIDAANAEGTIFLSYGSEQPADLLEVQRAILEAGLLIAQVIPAFDRYSTGSRDLYVLRMTEDTLPLVEGDYTEEFSDERQTYACTLCGRQLTVGGEASGRFATLHDLEEAGCPTCGGRTFTPILGHPRGGNGVG